MCDMFNLLQCYWDLFCGPVKFLEGLASRCLLHKNALIVLHTPMGDPNGGLQVGWVTLCLGIKDTCSGRSLLTTITQLCGSLHGPFMTQAALFTESQPGCPLELPPLHCWPLPDSRLLHWILDCKLMDQQQIQLTDRHISLDQHKVLKTFKCEYL